MRKLFVAVSACTFSLAIGHSPSLAQQAPDLIVHNANVQTMDAPNTKAQAVAVRSGKIVAVGNDAAILNLAGANTRKIDAAGKTLLPGLIDSHIHTHGVGLNLSKVPMNDLSSLSQLLKRVAEKAAKTESGKWIEGASDWHESQLKENRFPTRWELDTVAPNNPVFLRRGGHNVVINTTAMKLANIGERDKNPAGGHYHRDKQGRFDGWVLERPAIQRIARLLPKSPPSQVKQELLRAMRTLSAAGLTAVRSQHIRPPELRAWKALAKSGEAILRGVLVLSIHPRRPAKVDIGLLEKFKLKQGQGDDMVRIDGLKLTHDGGVETGLLNRDYANRPGFRGIEVTPLSKVKEMSEYACKTGWRMSLHAVGDRAIQNVLDAWSELNERCSIVGKRWASEHTYLPSKANIETMKRLGIAVHVQTNHNYTLGVGWLEFWGRELAHRLIPNRTMIDAGLRPSGGTDAPVTPFNPFLAMWVDVTRNTVAAGILGKQEAVTPLESLKMHTIWAAEGLNMKDKIGSIEPGKYADLVLVSANPLTVPVDQIRDIRADMTIMNGKIVFKR